MVMLGDPNLDESLDESFESLVNFNYGPNFEVENDYDYGLFVGQSIPWEQFCQMHGVDPKWRANDSHGCVFEKAFHEWMVGHVWHEDGDKEWFSSEVAHNITKRRWGLRQLHMAKAQTNCQRLCINNKYGPRICETKIHDQYLSDTADRHSEAIFNFNEFGGPLQFTGSISVVNLGEIPVSIPFGPEVAQIIQAMPDNAIPIEVAQEMAAKPVQNEPIPLHPVQIAQIEEIVVETNDFEPVPAQPALVEAIVEPIGTIDCPMEIDSPTPDKEAEPAAGQGDLAIDMDMLDLSETDTPILFGQMTEGKRDVTPYVRPPIHYVPPYIQKVRKNLFSAAGHNLDSQKGETPPKVIGDTASVNQSEIRKQLFTAMDSPGTSGQPETNANPISVGKDSQTSKLGITKQKSATEKMYDRCSFM